METLRKKILNKAGLYYSLARSGNFAAQGLLLPFVTYLATGTSRAQPKEFKAHLGELLLRIKSIHEKDFENIKNGLYPVEVLYPESILKHALRYPQVLLDAFRAAQRRDKKSAHEFSDEANEYLADLPEYYKRNFHFQTGGYLSKVSAELYEHQVEILFSGAADAMRRLIIPPMKIHFEGEDGEGLHFLELASGTGRLTRSLALAFPKAKITCVDLSPMYLAKARERLKDFKNINFVQGAGEKLTFKPKTFNAVVSCFLFHELPMAVREKVLAESLRCLKPMGFLGLVDSIQKNDDQEFQWALKQFPLDFHEPFYKNYVQHPMETQLELLGLKNVQTEVGFLSKAVSGIKA
ncbi:MAG: class I SAM-dependent methyltransferase [Bdellovibrionaceae bacterium]|nr:class I SAM-dependent methyltransferase [Bdellovibrio sp.]